MSELPSHFVAQEPADPDSTSEKLLNPELAQAQVVAQTIQRFQALNREIDNIVDRQEQERAWTKLDALATREYGKAWEVLRQPEVEVIPMMIGGKTKDELKQKLIVNGYVLGLTSEEILDNHDFLTLPNPKPVVLVRLKVADLGFQDYMKIDELLTRVKKLGLELCPPEVGPWYRLHTPDQPMGKSVYVGMQPIEDADGDPYIFCIRHDVSGRWFSGSFADQEENWHSNFSFLFRLPLIRPDSTGATHE